MQHCADGAEHRYLRKLYGNSNATHCARITKCAASEWHVQHLCRVAFVSCMIAPMMPRSYQSGHLSLSAVKNSGLAEKGTGKLLLTITIADHWRGAAGSTLQHMPHILYQYVWGGKTAWDVSVAWARDAKRRNLCDRLGCDVGNKLRSFILHIYMLLSPLHGSDGCDAMHLNFAQPHLHACH
jgi:hypothetical protein